MAARPTATAMNTPSSTAAESFRAATACVRAPEMCACSVAILARSASKSALPVRMSGLTTGFPVWLTLADGRLGVVRAPDTGLRGHALQVGRGGRRQLPDDGLQGPDRVPLLGHALVVRGQEVLLAAQRVAPHAGLLVDQRGVEPLDLELGRVDRADYPLAVVVQAEQGEAAGHHRGHREQQQDQQGDADDPAERPAPVRPRPWPPPGQPRITPRTRAHRETAPAASSPGADRCRRSGRSWFGRGRETEGQDGQVVVQVSSVELADTIDHLVEQLLPELAGAAQGVPDQVHQAFAAEPL